MNSKCRVCGARPKRHIGVLDSDFVACECKNDYGIYLIAIYGGWDLPKQWRLDVWYALKFYTAKLVRHILNV